MSRRPGVPSLLRQLNDRSAFELLLTDGPLTRTRLGELTGLSKVTASQMVVRLQERGLVEVVGTQSGGRGPSAELYAVRGGCSHGAGIQLEPDALHAELADITGTVVGRSTRPFEPGAEPVALVAETVHELACGAGVNVSTVTDVVIGAPGVVNPETGDISVSFDLATWHHGLRESLARRLDRDVHVENDVNLAAMAEQVEGAGRDVEDMALLWLGRGVGLAVIVGGRLYRGATGAAGEVGYLPVPGAPDRATVVKPSAGAFQGLVGERAVADLAVTSGFAHESAVEAVRSALDGEAAGERFLNELVDRVAVGVAAICTVVDPARVVISGEVGVAADPRMCDMIGAAVSRIAPVSPQVVPTGVPEHAVLRGAVLAAVERARTTLF